MRLLLILILCHLTELDMKSDNVTSPDRFLLKHELSEPLIASLWVISRLSQYRFVNGGQKWLRWDYVYAQQQVGYSGMVGGLLMSQ